MLSDACPFLSEQRYDPASAIAGPLCSDPTEHLAEAYFRGIGGGLCRRPEANLRSGLEVMMVDSQKDIHLCFGISSMRQLFSN